MTFGSFHIFKHTGKLVFATIFKDFLKQIPSYAKKIYPISHILAPLYPREPRFKQT